jgi:NodT family efflux transporter outer membrane factor (OMF) lipoprotein
MIKQAYQLGRNRRAALLGGAVLLLAGCVPKSPPLSFPNTVPERFRNDPVTTGSLPLRKPNPMAWWRAPNDAHLTRLVERALTDNPRLEQALARVQAAKGLARAESAQSLPSLTDTTSLDVKHRLAGSLRGLNEKGEDIGRSPKRTVGSYQRGTEFLWEVDLFGRARSAVRAAQAGALAAEEEANAARIDLISETARTYVELRGAQARRAILARDAAARQDIADMTRRRKDAGIAGAYDLQRAIASSEATRARLPSVELEYEKALQRLATLVGSPAANPALMQGAPIPALSIPASGLPLDLLRTRADMRVAEWKVIQQAAQVGVAQADLYPRLTLTGSLTLSGNVIGQPLVGNVLQVAGGPSLSIPLLDWGQRRAIVDVRGAELKEALAVYRQAVLSAVEEVEIALASIRQTREKVARLSSAAQSAKSALDMSDRLFRNGMISIEERLNTETEYRAAELSLAEAREASSIAVVALYRALGGPDAL